MPKGPRESLRGVRGWATTAVLSDGEAEGEAMKRQSIRITCNGNSYLISLDGGSQPRRDAEIFHQVVRAMHDFHEKQTQYEAETLKLHEKLCKIKSNMPREYLWMFDEE